MERKKPFPVGRALEGKSVVQVSCGGMHTVALTDKGKVGCVSVRVGGVCACMRRCEGVSAHTCMCVNPRCFIFARGWEGGGGSIIAAKKLVVSETVFPSVHCNLRVKSLLLSPEPSHPSFFSLAGFEAAQSYSLLKFSTHLVHL